MLLVLGSFFVKLVFGMSPCLISNCRFVGTTSSDARFVSELHLCSFANITVGSCVESCDFVSF